MLYEFKNRNSAAEAARNIYSVYENEFMNERTCRRWFTKFSSGGFIFCKFFHSHFPFHKLSECLLPLQLLSFYSGTHKALSASNDFLVLAC